MFNFLKKKEPEVSPEYQNWRKLILGLSSTGILKGIPDELYCVLMDVGMGDGKTQYFAISMYANNDGESSLKASSGAGVIGLGGIEEISKYPEQIIQIGQSLIHLTSPTKNLDYPEANRIFFYFLTTSGVRVYKCSLNDIKNGHPFNEIFSYFSTIKGFADRAMEDQQKKSP